MKSGFGASPSMPSHYQQALLQGYILSILLECGGSRDQTSFFWGNFFISECNGANSHDVPYNVVQCPSFQLSTEMLWEASMGQLL